MTYCRFIFFTDKPTVTLNEVSDVIYDQLLKYKANIRCSPKQKIHIIWMKGENCIDINQPKYAGSSDVGVCPELCINNATSEDEDIYAIEVRSDLGTGTCLSKRLVVLEGKSIHFRTVFFYLVLLI